MHDLVLAAFVSLVVELGSSVTTANAAGTIYVTTTAPEIDSNADCSLQEAIYAANLDASRAPDPANLGDRNAFITTGCAAGSGDDTIVLPTMATFTMSGPVADVFNYVGPTATPMVTSNIVIEAAGAKLVYGGGPVPYRAFAVGRAGGGTGVAGDLTLHEIHVKGFEVQGGDGAGGGGGGLGAGGAVYVSEGALSVGWSTFEQNGALGGDGSSGNTVGAGGGGGGLGGDGGRPSSRAFAAGGGGGGARGDGGSAFDPEGFATLAAGGGGTLTAGSEFGDGGFACGGDGGFAGTIGGSNGDNAGCRGGGGGGGASESGITVPSGDGGDGSYGGGSGGGGYSAGDGGRGGFGGGGGAGPSFSSSDGNSGGSGGDGGFGAGGGAGPGGLIFGDPGAGGTFGGDAGDEHGGGGAGLGGAIFGDRATITIRNSTFFNNYANRGRSGGTGANDGRGAGGAIFLVAGPLFVNNSTFNNNQTGEFTAGVGGLGGGGIVVYQADGEAASLTLRNSILAGNGPHECYARNGANVSGVGNLIADNSANNRGDANCSGVVTSADPQLQTLALNPPGRTPTMKIPATSPAKDAADAATSEPDDQRGAPRPQGGGFDIGAYEAADSPPTTAIALTPDAPNGSNGWYRTAVGVTITALDDGDPAPITRCGLNLSNSPTSFDDLPEVACTPFSVVVDSALHTLYAASRDANGNTESPLVTRSFKLDRTPPTLDPSLSASPVVGQTGVTVSANATDATSGVASSSCGAVDTSTPGPKTVTCTATDNAGNTRSVDFAYVVEYKILGFFSPIPKSKWRLLTTVPVKVALGDAAGTRLSDSEAAALATACRVRFSASGAQTLAPTCMKYDSAYDQFVYTWQLARNGTGLATIAVTVSYPGTTWTTQKTEQITITK